MMIQPRGTLRIAALLAILAPALTGCFVQSPQSGAQTTPAAPENTNQDTDEPASQNTAVLVTNSATETDKSDAKADITITVTPEKSANAAVEHSPEASTQEDDIDAVAEAVDAAIEQLNQAAEPDSQTLDNLGAAVEETDLPQSDKGEISDTPTRDNAPPKTAVISLTVDAIGQLDPPTDQAEPEPEPTASADVDDNVGQTDTSTQAVTLLCDEIGNKLGSVSVEDCLSIELKDSGARSRMSRSLAIKEYPQVGTKNSGRVLLMGGIHGDEFSSVSIIFKWLKFIHQEQANEFTWQVVPLLNPDGLLRKTSQRQNDAGVDLNRNFPSPDWRADALRYWENRTGSNPRRYPGPEAASEPETQWFIDTIEAFHPDAIVAVHAPHSLVDYDGPQQPPNRLGKLHLQELGIYPGSLGNYAGVYKNIPVVTIELPSAGIMPTRNDINLMWQDLIKWLQKEVPKQRLARTESNQDTSSATP